MFCVVRGDARPLLFSPCSMLDTQFFLTVLCSFLPWRCQVSDAFSVYHTPSPVQGSIFTYVTHVVNPSRPRTPWPNSTRAITYPQSQLKLGTDDKGVTRRRGRQNTRQACGTHKHIIASNAS